MLRQLVILSTLLFAQSLFASNWPQWRGPQGTGVSDESNLPLHWSTNENVRWRAPLPDKGNSTPVIWGNRVFIVQAIEDKAEGKHRRTLMCFDKATGKVLWQSGITVRENELTHEDNPYCSASATSDGECVVAWYGAPGLYAYDLNGKEIWHRDLGPQRHIWGNGGSPILYQNLCILNFGPGERTFVIAVDKKSGKTVWQHDEPGGDSGEKKPDQSKAAWIGSWSTPVAARVENHDELLVSFPSRVAAFDPITGKERWTCRGLNPLVYTSPLYANGVVVAMGGFGGSALAAKAGGEGDITEKQRLWQVPRNKQRIGSGVISGDHIYILDDPGVAECIELKTGKVVWEQRLKGKASATDSWASMVLAGDKLYVINKAGDAFVLRASPQFELLSTSSLGERTLASIAPSDGNLFIRTYKALWCIGPAGATN